MFNFSMLRFAVFKMTNFQKIAKKCFQKNDIQFYLNFRILILTNVRNKMSQLLFVRALWLTQPANLLLASFTYSSNQF
jgi:hypothetical protein